MRQQAPFITLLPTLDLLTVLMLLITFIKKKKHTERDISARLKHTSATSCYGQSLQKERAPCIGALTR